MFGDFSLEKWYCLGAKTARLRRKTDVSSQMDGITYQYDTHTNSETHLEKIIGFPDTFFRILNVWDFWLRFVILLWTENASENRENPRADPNRLENHHKQPPYYPPTEYYNDIRTISCLTRQNCYWGFSENFGSSNRGFSMRFECFLILIFSPYGSLDTPSEAIRGSCVICRLTQSSSCIPWTDFQFSERLLSKQKS